MISKNAATLSVISADDVASHAKRSSNDRCPVWAATLTMSIGKKMRKPVAAARPTPSAIDNGRSGFDMQHFETDVTNRMSCRGGSLSFFLDPRGSNAGAMRNG